MKLSSLALAGLLSLSPGLVFAQQSSKPADSPAKDTAPAELRSEEEADTLPGPTPREVAAPRKPEAEHKQETSGPTSGERPAAETVRQEGRPRP
jgi:hypothetical protein